MSDHHFYATPLREIEVGQPPLAVLVFAEPVVPANLGFRHVCGTWPDEQEPDGTFTKIVAPRLSKHTVSGPEDALTIRASIACSGCGLHGYVTDGVWTSVG